MHVMECKRDRGISLGNLVEMRKILGLEALLGNQGLVFVDR